MFRTTGWQIAAGRAAGATNDWRSVHGGPRPAGRAPDTQPGADAVRIYGDLRDSIAIGQIRSNARAA